MGLGINYIAPNFRKIEFDTGSLGEVDKSGLASVPKSYTIKETGTYLEMRDRMIGEYTPGEIRTILDSAPSGKELMLVLSQ